MYLSRNEFDFYFDNFTINNCPKETSKNYQYVKRLMIDRFYPRKPEAVIMIEAAKLNYGGGYIKEWAEKTDRQYRDTKCNESSKF